VDHVALGARCDVAEFAVLVLREAHHREDGGRELLAGRVVPDLSGLVERLQRDVVAERPLPELGDPVENVPPLVRVGSGTLARDLFPPDDDGEPADYAVGVEAFEAFDDCLLTGLGTVR
jgi:hypothetical protein